ncbi:DUF4082 domain-containing protein [Bradyrhizobium sp. Ai1a-2]|uniref:DUF4082 domain-containing protein n=1 Tax=Bradyrhizobium sp. Ai1a-2 TaxID=196490 RepID=UPI000422A7F1|nr:DUF4082 domain-containing protein [Bradyrhizobium sp. Ai1a-2]
MTNPVVILGHVPSANSTPHIIGSSTSPAVAQICGCGYFIAPTRLLDQRAANAAPAQLSSQLHGSHVSGGADFVLTGHAGMMGASVSADMSLANVAPLANWNALSGGGPIRDWGVLPGGGETGSGTGKTEIGILSGSVTSATPAPAARQAATTASPNLLAAAAASTNPIVLENQKQGNPESEWGIDGAGSSNIEGFATDISINRGNRIDFKINTNSSNYRIDIYRLGYYGGMGARKVATIQHTGVQNQPAPLRDASTGLVDAGNWAVSASWDVPADAASGVYIAKLVRQDGTSGENHIPFIVRDDSSTSDVVFQTSDTTWQAYNGWGGANFYGGNGPATGQGAGRAYAVSYNRPIATRGNVGTFAGPQDYLFGAEYAAIYWLEQNGYDVSYMSGVDADRYGSLLLNHNLYLDVGHDEYWSGQQRANVQAARDAGVNLAFWSGNEMYWRTRWGNSISSGATPYRTLISYKETWSPGASIDPSNEWTGTFRDPRLSPPAIGGGIPENALIGQMFQVDDVGQGNLQAIKIPYDDANLRFWRNTSVANLQPGQTATLTKNYLGYEWDEAVDNGFDPAGLVRLSSTTVPVSTYLLDYGNTTGSGTSTHNLTLYRAASGALVFGAGTVYWAWGLSDNHDLAATPTDPRVQQAMINLLADMGIQPGTLQPGMIATTASADTTRPTSTINALASLVAGNVVTISGTAADLGGGVVAGVEVSTDGGASWHPAIGDETWTYTWSPQVAGTYTILSRAVDDSINLEAPSAGRSVTVTAPNYITLFPGSATPDTVNTTDASAAELGVRFQTAIAGTMSGVRFYKSSQDTGTHTGSLWTSTGTLLATATFTNETATGWQSVVFSSPVTLTPGATYVASYHTNVGHYSSSANYFTGNVTSGPLTAPGSGNGVYTYSSNRAFPTSTFSATNFWVDVMFNPSTANIAPVAVNDAGPTATRDLAMTIAASSLTANDSDPNGDSLVVTAVSGATNGTVVLNTQSNPQNNTITFTPNAGYTGPASFAYTISDGRGGTASATVNFTVALPGAAPVSLFSASSTPAQTNLNDGSQLQLGMKFTSSVAGQITALRFYRSPGDTGINTLDLWTSTGTRLSTATFSSTSASGWQTVTLPSAVSITANTTYIASYHTTGAYVATNSYFTAAVTNGPLTAPSTTTAGGNGVYAYGGTSTSGIFPTNTYNAANYWVDVVFTPSSGAGNQPPVANNDSGYTTTQNTAVTIAASALLANDTDPNGDPLTITGASGAVNGTVSFNAQTNVVTFTPTTGYTGAASFTYAISDGRGGTASATANLTVNPPANQPPVANNDSGYTTTQNTALTVAASALLANDTDPNGDPLTITGASGAVNGTVSFNAQTNVVTFTPTTGYTGAASFNYAISDGRGGTASATANLTVSPAANQPPVANNDSGYSTTQNTALTIAASALLANDTDPNGDPLTITGASGAVNGTVSFNAQTNVVTFTPTTGYTGAASFTYAISDGRGGTASATANLTVSPAANQPPVANNDSGYSTTQNTALTIAASALLANDTDPNGDPLTITGASGAVNGTVSFNAQTNVVTFTPTTGYTGAASFTYAISDGRGGTASATANLTVNPAANQPPVANNDSGYTTTQNTALTIAASALLANDTDPNGDPLTITGASGAVNGTVSFNAQTNVVTFTPTAGYTGAASFSYAISDGRGGTASATANLTVNPAANQPPVANNDSGYSTTQNTAVTIAASALLANDTDPNGDPLTITGASGAVNGTVSFNAQTNVVTFTPTTGYTGAASFIYAISDGRGGTASATANLTVTTATVSLFSTSNTPANVSNSDTSQVNLGVRFTSSVAGTVTGIRYYKGANDTGTHTGSLWSSTGTLLTTATFTNETTSGWQTVTFNSPVSITAGTTYVASFHSNGRYATTANYFTTARVNGPLTASAGNNGVYTYGTGNLFPTSTFNATNYWVDVLFSPASGGTNQAPVAANDSGFSATQNSALSIPASALLANDTDPNGDALTITGVSNGTNGTASFNAQTNTVTFTPSSGYTGPASFSYAISDGRGGTASASASLTVNAASASVISLFSSNPTPSTVSVNDPSSVELGFRFQSSSAGDITGLRFYKGPTNTGTHTANLWSSTGTLLATATFTNETASGWQQVNFATPVTITAGATYTASYHTSGNYSADPNLFASAVSNGPLTAPSSASIGGNGVYAYGSSSLFPTNTYNATSYGVDVLFRPQLAA